MTRTPTNTSAAAAYYNEPNVADFYRLCWGGADIHIGRYDRGDETIAEASAAMTRHLLRLSGVGAGDRVLDIACGFGGTLRMLAELGCRPEGLDIAEACVDAARAANREAGLGDSIPVEVGDFHAIASDDVAWDAAWDAVVCQDSLIHSPDRPRVFAEVHRVLRPGGVFALSDILTAEGADLAMVDAAFSRLRVNAGATPRDYRDMAVAAGFAIEHGEERPRDITTHYAKLSEALTDHSDEIGRASCRERVSFTV